MDLDGLIWLDECVRTLLAHAVLSTERDSVSNGEGFTEGAEEENNKTSATGLQLFGVILHQMWI